MKTVEKSPAEKTHKTAVVLIPPKTIWPPIQAIRERHDKQFRRWMPHVTLLYPFREKEQFEQLVKPLAEVCQTIKPFEVVLSGFDCFRHRGANTTFWLKPEPGEALAELQTRLWEVVPDCSEVRCFGGGFMPHVSVGQAHSKRVFQNLEKRLSALPSLRFSASHVSLIWRGDPPNDVFRESVRIALGSGRRETVE